MKKKGEKSQSSLDFKIMSFMFKIRDKFNPPLNKIKNSGVKHGQIVLDYGCGPGSYTIAAAEIIGPSGRVYAADIKPIAIKSVQKKALKKGFANIKTIITDHDTGLKDNEVDVIICFDMFHEVENKEIQLKEFHRILKPNSILSFDDHHMKEEEIISTITSQGLFKLAENKESVYNFIRT